METEVVTKGKFRVTFIEKDDGEILLKVQSDNGIAVFPKSDNTVIIANMRTESAQAI